MGQVLDDRALGGGCLSKYGVVLEDISVDGVGAVTRVRKIGSAPG